MRFIASPNFNPGGNRMLRVTIHTSESDGTAAQLGQNWLSQPKAQVAYHYGVDAGEVVQYVREEDRAWHNVNGNDTAIGVAFIGRASRTRDSWLAWPALDRGVAIVADICKRRGIPPVKLTTADWNTKRGIAGHRDVPGNQHNRTDPGDGFPWDAFLARVRARLDGATTPPAPAPPVSGDVTVVAATPDGKGTQATRLDATAALTGGVSWFGGPGDASTLHGTMALSGEPGATPRDHWYAAMRWSYCQWEPYNNQGETWLRPVAGTSDLAEKNRLAGRLLMVTLPRTGKSVIVRAADTGPRPAKRVVDVSPHALQSVLGGRTDDQVQVRLAPAGAVPGEWFGPVPTAPARTDTPKVRPPVDKQDLILDQLAGPVQPDGTRSWPQLGDRSVVDALAAIGENLGIEGMKAPR